MKLLILVLILSTSCFAQTQSTKPPSVQKCGVQNSTWNYNQPSGITVLYVCSQGSWNFAGALAPIVPVGTNIIIDSGGCPASFEENTGLDGLTLIATTTAHGDIGTTGGSNTVTPSLSGNPTLSGTPGVGSLASFLTGSVGGSSSLTGTVGGSVSAGTLSINDTLGVTANTLAFSGNSHTGLNVPGGTFTVNVFESFIGADGSTSTESVLNGATASVTFGPLTTSTFTPSGSITGSPGLTGGVSLSGAPTYIPGNGTLGVSYTPSNGTLGTSLSGAPSAGTLAVGVGTLANGSIDNRSAFKKVIFCKKS